MSNKLSSPVEYLRYDPAAPRTGYGRARSVRQINGLWHSTAMAGRYEGMLEPLRSLFGAVVMHDQASDAPGVGRRGGMVWLGDNSIEIGAPFGEHSPVRNFVERWGGGMHSIALHVGDAQETEERLLSLGLTVQARLDEHMFFTNPGESAGLLLEWSDRRTDDDPRGGHSLPDLPAPPVVTTRRYAFVTAVVTDPRAVAGRLAALLGTEVVGVRDDAGPDEVAAIVPLVDCLLLLFPMPPEGSSVDLWGRDIRRNRFHGHGLLVDDVADALPALETHGVRAVGTRGGMIYLDPGVLPIPTFLVDELLAEDPRRSTPLR